MCKITHQTSDTMKTKNELSDIDKEPQQEQKHPERVREDLNPDRMAGQNIGPESAPREDAPRQGETKTAYDAKEVHEALDLSDDLLKKIPLVPEGRRLQTGATYVDLKQEARAPFTAQGRATADADHWYVAKDRVPYRIWNHLIGEEKPGEHL